MEQQRAIEILQAGASSLSAHNWEFATSMLDQYRRRGRLSDKQWVWVIRFAERIERSGIISSPVTHALGMPMPLPQVQPVQEPAPISEPVFKRPPRKIILGE